MYFNCFKLLVTRSVRYRNYFKILTYLDVVHKWQKNKKFYIAARLNRNSWKFEYPPLSVCTRVLSEFCWKLLNFNQKSKFLALLSILRSPFKRNPLWVVYIYTCMYLNTVDPRTKLRRLMSTWGIFRFGFRHEHQATVHCSAALIEIRYQPVYR